MLAKGIDNIYLGILDVSDVSEAYASRTIWSLLQLRIPISIWPTWQVLSWKSIRATIIETRNAQKAGQCGVLCSDCRWKCGPSNNLSNPTSASRSVSLTISSRQFCEWKQLETWQLICFKAAKCTFKRNEQKYSTGNQRSSLQTEFHDTKK